MTTFPKNLNSKGGTDSLYYDLNGSRLEVYADISKNIIWLDGAKKPGVNWRPDTPIATLGPWRFYMKLLIVFTAPSPVTSKVIWEKDLLPFLSGGQFESNRRRH